MDEIQKYTLALTDKAKNYLSKEYNLGSFRISDFQAINFFLIDKALNSNKSLFIQSFDSDLPSLSQFPTVLSVALSLFAKNFCDDKTTYEIGEVLQKDGIRYEITSLTNTGYTLITNSQGGYTKEVNAKSIKKYIVTNADLSNRKVKTRFDDYRNLFKLVYNADYVPSKFNYKAAIILEKKEFDEELSNQDYTDLDIIKAIPLRWISKNGTQSWHHIPIEPMIYCVPDYDTLVEQVLDKGEKIEALVVLGKNKYKDDILSKIKRDLREGTIPVSVILGNEQILDKNNQFFQWKWNYDEYSYLNRSKRATISSIPVKSLDFETAIANYMSFLSEMEVKFTISLSNVKSLRRHLFPITWPKSENSRSINQSESFKHFLIKVSEESITDHLYNLNQTTDHYLEKNEELINLIFASFNNEKFKSLLNLSGVDILVIPDAIISIWQQEFKSRYKVLSYKEFLDSHQNYTTSKDIVMLSLFGYEKNPASLITGLNNTTHKYYFLTYQEEMISLTTIQNQLYNINIQEYQSIDRKKISGLDFELNPEPVSISDIIEDLHNLSQKEQREYDYGELDSVNHKILFINSNEIMICEGSKSVLLFINGRWEKCKIRQLMPGDKVRIYNNLTKELLFTIAAQDDTHGRFNKIDHDSKCWKNALNEYIVAKREISPQYSIDILFRELQSQGSTISNIITLKKWLNQDEKERFPNSLKNLIAIKDLITVDSFNSNFDSIKRSRRMYRGVMIALGRDLSDEVMDYIVSKGKIIGKILNKFSEEEIRTFVQSSAPERIILTISITEEDESI